MKNSIVVSIMIVLMSVITTNAQDLMKDHFIVQVDGLGCPFCAVGLEKRFSKLEGSSNIKIDLEKGILEFDYLPEKKFGLKDVKYQIESAGYTPIKGEVLRSSGEKKSATFTKEKK